MGDAIYNLRVRNRSFAPPGLVFVLCICPTAYPWATS